VRSDPSMQRVDKPRARASFERAARAYGRFARLQREVGGQLMERLDLVRLQPVSVVDVGSGPGLCTGALARRYRKARVVALDFAHAMLREARRRRPWFRQMGFVCADVEALPLAQASCDLVFSNLTLQWCHDLDRTLFELRRVLRPFTTLGPDTLKELRESWAAVDGYTHVNLFLDMHDVGDAMLRAGLAEPVLDVERITLHYLDVFALMGELKGLGAHNVTAGRARGLTGPRRLQAMAEAYESRRAEAGLPATYEVIFGHAWGAQAGVHGTPARVEVSLDRLRPRR
jgi:malonyl-CoA O-methyltransferase